MIKARCIRECTWRGRHWKEGSVYRGAALPPGHFRVLEEFETTADEAAGAEEEEIFVVEEEKNLPKCTRRTKRDDGKDDSVRSNDVADDGEE